MFDPCFGGGGNGKVRVYDSTTRSITLVSKADLDPRFVPAQVEGIEGLVWVDPSQLKQGELCQPPFGEERLARIREIRSHIDEVYPMSIEEWEDGFRRDVNPDSEINMWLRVGRCYARLAAEWQENEAARKEVFTVLVACITRGKKDALVDLGLSVLSGDQARAIVDSYFTEDQWHGSGGMKPPC